jgi:hypothetical protein
VLLLRAYNERRRARELKESVAILETEAKLRQNKKVACGQLYRIERQIYSTKPLCFIDVAHYHFDDGRGKSNSSQEIARWKKNDCNLKSTNPYSRLIASERAYQALYTLKNNPFLVVFDSLNPKSSHLITTMEELKNYNLSYSDWCNCVAPPFCDQSLKQNFELMR